MAARTDHRRITDAVWDSTLPPLQRLVMLAYLKYAHGKKGIAEVWLSRPELRRVTGLSLNALNRAVRGLEAAGWLVVVTPATQHHSTRYRLASPSSARGASLASPSSAREDISSARGASLSSASRAPESLQESLSNPSPPSSYVSTGSAPAAAKNGGRAPHQNEPNARRAIATLVTERALPFTEDTLLDLAYTVAADPWTGYLTVKAATEQSFNGARDPMKVLRKRLGLAS